MKKKVYFRWDFKFQIWTKIHLIFMIMNYEFQVLHAVAFMHENGVVHRWGRLKNCRFDFWSLKFRISGIWSRKICCILIRTRTRKSWSPISVFRRQRTRVLWPQLVALRGIKFISLKNLWVRSYLIGKIKDAWWHCTYKRTDLEKKRYISSQIKTDK